MWIVRTWRRRYRTFCIWGRHPIQFKMDKRAQAAMEYLVLTGFSLLILLILLTATYQRMSLTEKSLDLDSAERATFRIKEAADFVYTHGHPTKLTIPVYIPKDIEPSHTYIGNYTINIALRGGPTYTDVWRPTRGRVEWDVSGATEFPMTEGYYTMVVESTEYGGVYNGTINIYEG